MGQMACGTNISPQQNMPVCGKAGGEEKIIFSQMSLSHQMNSWFHLQSQHISDTCGMQVQKNIFQKSSDVCLPFLSERVLSVCFLAVFVIFLDFLTIH